MDEDLTAILTQVRLRNLDQNQLRTLMSEIEKLHGEFAIWYVSADDIHASISNWAKFFGGIWSTRDHEWFEARDLDADERRKFTHYTQTFLRRFRDMPQTEFREHMRAFVTRETIDADEDNDVTALRFLEYVE